MAMDPGRKSLLCASSYWRQHKDRMFSVVFMQHIGITIDTEKNFNKEYLMRNILIVLSMLLAQTITMLRQRALPG